MMFPKSPRKQNRTLLDMARGKPCLIQSPICNHDPETTVACHGAGVAAGKGMGYKVSDYLTVHGCSNCNNFTDAYNGATADEKRRAWEAGHVRQIIEWNKIVNLKQGKPKEIAAAQWALDCLKGI